MFYPNQSGYPRNEWGMIVTSIIIVSIFFLCEFAGYSSIEEQEENKEKMGCEYYSSFPMKDVPAKCINYFSNKK